MDIKDLISSTDYTCAGERDGVLLFALRGMGIKPLILVHEQAPQLLAGARLCDKVIGKAAATLCVLAGVKSVHGLVMSETAATFLGAHGITHSCDESVPFIQNRTGDGLCPLESACAAIADPRLAYAALRARIAELMAPAGAPVQ